MKTTLKLANDLVKKYLLFYECSFVIIENMMFEIDGTFGGQVESNGTL